MKSIVTALFILTSLHTFAQNDHTEERIIKQARVTVRDLRCVLPLGNEERIYTEKNPKVEGTTLETLMKHETVSVKGCDKALITKIELEARMDYDFATVTVTIIKQTSKQAYLVSGQCVKVYTEQLELDFENGLVLKSPPSRMLIPATASSPGCVLKM